MIARALLVGAAVTSLLSIASARACEPAPAAALPLRSTLPAQDTTEALVGKAARAWFQAEWRSYASRFVTPDGRIVDNANRNVSHSEGQGYGLLLAATAGDAERFDTIWRWTERHLGGHGNPLFAWQWDPATAAVADTNNATDGDILIAWGLAEGAKRFGRPDYREAAKGIASALGEQVVKSSEHGRILMPGVNGFAAKDRRDGPIVNLSYWVYPAFRVLNDLVPDQAWEEVHANGLRLLSQSRFGPLHLPTDWLSVASAKPAPATGFPPNFGYDALRIPLYLAWDPSPAAGEALKSFAAVGGGPAAFVIDVPSGSTAGRLDGAGYRMVLSLARCAAGQPLDPQLIRTRDTLYYPETLRLLSAAVIQERYPQCL